MRRKKSRLCRVALRGAAFDTYVFDNGSRERAVKIVKNRSAESWMELFSRESTTDPGAAFENERLVSRTGEIKCRDKRILTGSYDNDIVAFCHLTYARKRSERTLYSM